MREMDPIAIVPGTIFGFIVLGVAAVLVLQMLAAVEKRKHFCLHP